MDLVNEFSLLYRFLTAPITTVSEETPSFRVVLLVSAVYTLGIYSTSGWGFGLFGYISLTLLCLVLGIAAGILIDTVAQLLLKCPPQGLRTGYWLIIAQLPGLLGFPFSQIANTLQIPGLLWVANAGVSILVLWLQFQILKTIYKVSSVRSALLLIAVPVTIVSIVLLITFSGATYLMHLG